MPEIEIRAKDSIGICLCNQSALAAWRHFDNRTSNTPVFGHTPNAGPISPERFPSRLLASVRDLNRFSARFSRREMNLASWGIGPADTVHVLVSRAQRECRSPRVETHTSSVSASRGMFLQLEFGVYAVSPELHFVRSAADNGFLKQLLLGYELCGCYSIRPNREGGLFQRPPLCSTTSLARLTGDLRDAHGVNAAKTALAYVRDGSGSPRETALTLIMCLPMKYGGFGLPFPDLNINLDLGKSGEMLWQSKNAFDMAWAKERLIMEYDGFAEHEGSEARERDNMRRDAAIAAGYTVLVVTKRQLATVAETYAIAKAAARHLGKRLRFRDGNFREKHLELRRFLLGIHA